MILQVVGCGYMQMKTTLDSGPSSLGAKWFLKGVVNIPSG